MTCLYINRDEDKTEKTIFKEFLEDVHYKVQIAGLLIVPGKIVTAICFTDHKTENRFPHVTLMVNEWSPVYSNNLLEASCGSAKSPFHEVY